MAEIIGHNFIMFDSPSQEIKNRLDIVDVVREYVSLEKAGSNFRALCPFHAEKTPSFFVNPARQIWRCFGGCNVGGDIFSFVMRIEGLEFPDALRILAQKAGVELKKQDPKTETKKKRLFDVCESATLFFERQMAESKGGKKAMKYLLDRMVSKESIKQWRLGYAPTAEDSLYRYLVGEGHRPEEIAQAGLAAGKNRRFYDRFRARIIFPVFNLSGYPVGLGGRTLFAKDERAKYVNTPVTPLYDKSALLYGMHRAKVGIRKEEFAIMTEGYIDVVLCHQEGYENTIASSGTALTSKQLSVLRRYTDKLYTAFDIDEAGGSATRKSIDLAREYDFEVKVIMMPEGKDPADMIAGNPQEWKNSVNEAKSVMDFYFENTLSKYDLKDPYNKKKAATELLLEIKKIRNSIEQSHYVSRLSRALGVSEDAVWQELAHVKVKEDTKIEKEPIKQEQKCRKDLLEERVAAFCVKDKDLLQEANEEEICLLREELAELLKMMQKEEKLSPQQEDLLNYLSFLPDADDDFDKKKEIAFCIKEIKKEHIKEKLHGAEKELREAEAQKNEQREEELMQEINKYSKELQKL